MHYRDGRKAENGDQVVQLDDMGRITGFGVLFEAKPGSDYCNGRIAPLLGGPVQTACLCDCLHVESLRQLIIDAGLDKRPAGK